MSKGLGLAAVLVLAAWPVGASAQDDGVPSQQAPATAAFLNDRPSDLLADGNDLINAGKYDDALARFVRLTELQPDNGNAWAHRGLAHAWKGSLEAALVDTGRALELEPRNAVAYRARGLAYENRRDYVAAVEALDRAIEIEPGSAFAWGRRARAQMGRSKPVEAMADAAEALKLSPRYVEMFVLRAFALISLARAEEASAEIDALRAAVPDDPRAQAAARDLYGLMGQREKALAVAVPAAAGPDTPASLLSRARLRESNDTTNQLADLAKALELNPRFEPALHARASVYWRINRPELALADADALLALDPTYTTAHLMRADLLRRLDRREEAIAQLKLLAAVNPDDASARASAGQQYRDMGMLSEAIVELDRAVELDPERGPTRFQRANLHFAAQRYEQALTDVEQALRFNPEWAEAGLLKANSLRLLGRRDEAIAALAVMADQNVSGRQSRLSASKVYASFGMFDEAVAVIDRVLAEDPEPYLYLARSEARDPADLTGRMADIDEALRRAPTYGLGQIAKARLLNEQGNHQNALTLLNRAYANDQRNPILLILRGITFTRLGRTRDAERDFNQARTLAGTHPGMLNNICYEKAKAGVALERALAECNESLRQSADDAAILDSRAMVLLQMGRLDDAIADYDRVLEQSPDLAISLYGRAVAWSRRGDSAKAQADSQAALALMPTIALQMAQFGLTLDAAPAAAGN